MPSPSKKKPNREDDGDEPRPRRKPADASPARKTGGTLWLILGLLFGLAALGVCGLGGFSVFHTHGNVQMHEKVLDQNMDEMQRLAVLPNVPQNRARMEHLAQMSNVLLVNLREAKFHRTIGILILAASFVPGLLALVFLGIFAMKQFSKGAQKPSQNEDPEG